MMNSLSTKTAALTALIALGSILSNPAHANILRTVDGTPVLTAEGNCVLTGTDVPESCVETAQTEAVKPVVVEDHHERVVYFDFNKSTLTAKAKHHLDHLARKFNAHVEHGHNVASVTIVGFADRVGQAAYNEKLALKRAQTVQAYLTSKGVKAKKIEVRSLGKTEPKADCPADLPRAKLIDCLKEDRRVEIEFNAAK
jgi:OOP family OmpA-OmpF porin